MGRGRSPGQAVWVEAVGDKKGRDDEDEEKTLP